MPQPPQPNYDLRPEPGRATLPAPSLPYRVDRPRGANRPIGLIGCGGIAKTHLQAYRDLGLNVVALCDRHPDRVESARQAFFPDAKTCTDAKALLASDAVEVVDITTHVADRVRLIADALRAGRHVLSQKPFVLSLSAGERLADLADRHKVFLAVNQNGRWAPYYSYMRQAVSKGLIGRPSSVRFQMAWDHQWIVGTRFDQMRHVILFDFAIHWFDLAVSLMKGRSPERVWANVSRAAAQRAKPPLNAQAMVEFEGGGQASLSFDGACRVISQETATVVGSKGVLQSVGPPCAATAVRLSTPAGTAVAPLEGAWFADGFGGAMAELLSGIETKRQPQNNARDNLTSLALCFAAMASADTGRPQTVGKVRRAAAK